MTDYIKNVCTKTETLYPNLIIHGTPTISNGVVSGFSASNYLTFLDGYKFDNNAEYVIPFTTGSTTKSTVQDIWCAEKFFTLEIAENTWNVVTYNWETDLAVSLFTASANTTYWVKISVNGKAKTFSYSTDGENYTQVTSFTDNTMDTSDSFPLRIGIHSLNRLLSERAFLGSVDLNETYINVDNARFWDGMNYNKYLPIGGNSFKGQFVSQSLWLIFEGQIASETSRDFDISSYLPDDEYDYEVLISTSLATGTTSGNSGACMILTQPSASSTVDEATWWYGGSINTRANAFTITYGSVYCYVPNSYKHIIIRNNGTATAKYWVKLTGYRRVNTNNKENIQYVTNINNTNIGGDYFDGHFSTLNDALIYEADITSSGSVTVDLSNILPRDNYNYMFYGRMYAGTGSSSGNSIRMNVVSDICTNYLEICSAKTNTASTEWQKKPFQIPISGDTRTLTFGQSTGASGTGHFNCRACYIRRMGTNE